MAYTKADLVKDLHKAGVKEGMILVVHASYKAIGEIDGDPGTVCDALVEAVGKEGTIVMPTFSHPLPEMDLSVVPSRVGIVTEFFRKRSDVVRSPHPTHSVCATGPAAEEICAGHEASSALGVDSPLHRLAKLGGSVLQLGTTTNTCSLIHVAEAIAKVPFLHVCYAGYDIPIITIRTDGSRSEAMPISEPPGDSASFPKVETLMRERGQISDGTVGDAKTMLCSGADMLETAAIQLQDPRSMLCDNPNCAVCVEGHRIMDELEK